MSKRLDQEREKRLSPIRFDLAKKEIESRGFEIISRTDISFAFKYNGEYVIYYPYSGWATGKSIKDGRGLKNLLDQLTTTMESSTNEQKRT